MWYFYCKCNICDNINIVKQLLKNKPFYYQIVFHLYISCRTEVITFNICLFQARFLLSRVNPSQTHNNVYGWNQVRLILVFFLMQNVKDINFNTNFSLLNHLQHWYIHYNITLLYSYANICITFSLDIKFLY